MRLLRAQWAGLAGAVMALVQGAVAAAPVSGVAHATIESMATCILFVGGAILALTRDPRCQPKIDRLNDILMRALAKDLGVQDDRPISGDKPREP
jgi:hypothetical protein